MENNAKLTLKIHHNAFTDWVFKEQGLEQTVIEHFQRYTSQYLTPQFNEDYSEVVFSYTRGDNRTDDYIKISKGEESNFIWSIFYTLIQQVIDELNISEESDRSTQKFNKVEYIFIDDPVSSLDENHLIELAVNLAKIIKSSNYLKFMITTHNSIFYNILYNELGLKDGMLLDKNQDGSFLLHKKQGDSNASFSYHTYIKQILEKAIIDNSIEKYHFMLLRNLYEKTASFLGYQKWSELLPIDSRDSYYSRVMNFSSHSSLSNESPAHLPEHEKNIIKFLLNDLVTRYNFSKYTEEQP